MSESQTAAAPAPLTGRTAWARSLGAPVRDRRHLNGLNVG